MEHVYLDIRSWNVYRVDGVFQFQQYSNLMTVRGVLLYEHFDWYDLQMDT